MTSNYPIAMNIKTAVSLQFENTLKTMRIIETQYGKKELLLPQVMKNIKILKEFTAFRTFTSIFNHKIPHLIIQILLIVSETSGTMNKFIYGKLMYSSCLIVISFIVSTADHGHERFGKIFMKLMEKLNDFRKEAFTIQRLSDKMIYEQFEIR